MTRPHRALLAIPVILALCTSCTSATNDGCGPLEHLGAPVHEEGPRYCEPDYPWLSDVPAPILIGGACAAVLSLCAVTAAVVLRRKRSTPP